MGDACRAADPAPGPRSGAGAGPERLARRRGPGLRQPRAGGGGAGCPPRGAGDRARPLPGRARRPRRPAGRRGPARGSRRELCAGWDRPRGRGLPADPRAPRRRRRWPPGLGGRVPAGPSTRPHARVRGDRRAGDRGARRVRAGNRRPHPRGAAPAASARRAGTVWRAPAVLPPGVHARGLGARPGHRSPSSGRVAGPGVRPGVDAARTALRPQLRLRGGADRHPDRGRREPRGEGRSARADEPEESSGPRLGAARRGGGRGGSGRGGARAHVCARGHSCTSTRSAGS